MDTDTQHVTSMVQQRTINNSVNRSIRETKHCLCVYQLMMVEIGISLLSRVFRNQGRSITSEVCKSRPKVPAMAGSRADGLQHLVKPVVLPGWHISLGQSTPTSTCLSTDTVLPRPVFLAPDKGSIHSRQFHFHCHNDPGSTDEAGCID